MSTEKRLTVVLVLNLLLIASLVAVGLSAHCLGVLAAGGDYLVDSAAIGVSLLAIRLARRSAAARRPHGYPNATRITALVNAGWLLALSVLVAVTGAVILAARGLHRLDPAVALAIALIVGYQALKLVMKVIAALKPTLPPSPAA